MQFEPTAIPDVVLIKPQIYGDLRGFFMETYRKNLFQEMGIQVDFVQDNHSGSKRGTLRGLHYQIQQPQGKLIRVVAGEIYDVVVDLRRSAPTFSEWIGTHLSEENRYQLWVPVGFAHGFYVLSDWAEVVYKTTDYYAPKWERCLLWNDPQIGIQWPLAKDTKPIVSQKDSRGIPLDKADLFD